VLGRGRIIEEHNGALVFPLVEDRGSVEDALSGGDALLGVNLYLHAGLRYQTTGMKSAP
jgi:hypothetical protein